MRRNSTFLENGRAGNPSPYAHVDRRRLNEVGAVEDEAVEDIAGEANVAEVLAAQIIGKHN